MVWLVEVCFIPPKALPRPSCGSKLLSTHCLVHPSIIWLVVWNMAFIFPYIGNNNPIWHIFFRGVETTNQFYYLINLMIGDSELTHLNLWTYELLIAEVHRACQIWNQRRGDLLTPCVPVLLLVCRGKKGEDLLENDDKVIHQSFFLILDQAT